MQKFTGSGAPVASVQSVVLAGCVGMLLAGALCGCGAPPKVEEKYVPRGLDAPRPEVATDAFAEFRGVHVSVGKVFRLQGHPVAVDGPNVVLSLIKTDWDTMTTPGGKTTKTATAQFQVQKGAETYKVTISQDDSGSALGVRIHVKDAGEDYDKARMNYLAWVDCVVEAK